MCPTRSTSELHRAIQKERATSAWRRRPSSRSLRVPWPAWGPRCSCRAQRGNCKARTARDFSRRSRWAEGRAPYSPLCSHQGRFPEVVHAPPPALEQVRTRAALAEAALPFGGGKGHPSPIVRRYVTVRRRGVPAARPRYGPSTRSAAFSATRGLADLGGRSPDGRGDNRATTDHRGGRWTSSAVGSAGSGPAHRCLGGFGKSPTAAIPDECGPDAQAFRPRLAGFSARRSRDRLVPAG